MTTPKTEKAAAPAAKKKPAAPRKRAAPAAKPQQVAIPQDQQATRQMIEVIERVAMNPDVDVNKMEKLLDMQERILDRQARQEFDVAMANMQPELPVVKKNGQIMNKDGLSVRSTYAKFEDINKAVKPVLSQYGFSMTFAVNQDGSLISVVGNLAHKAGHRETTSITLGPDVSGNKNAVQAVASSVQYGKRYTMSALLNLIFEDEDDDAQTAEATLDTKQVDTITKLYAKSAKNIQDWIIKQYGSIDAIPQSHYAGLVTEMNAKMRKRTGAASRAEAIVDAAEGKTYDHE